MNNRHALEHAERNETGRFQASRMPNLPSAWWQKLLRVSRRAPKRLRLCETLPLGERRFVAVIEFEDSRFLVGGTSSSLVLLAQLNRGEDGMHSLPVAASPAASGEEFA